MQRQTVVLPGSVPTDANLCVCIGLGDETDQTVHAALRLLLSSSSDPRTRSSMKVFFFGFSVFLVSSWFGDQFGGSSSSRVLA